MKSVILILCVAAVALAQTRPPPNLPDNNPESTCGRTDRMCQAGQVCQERRVPSRNLTIAECIMRIAQGGECPRRNFFEGNNDDERRERNVEDTTREMPFERVARERASGGPDRDTARTVSGVIERPSCVEGQRCTDQNMCMPRPTNTDCEMARQRMASARCEDDGNFVPLQCRRVSGEESAARPTALNCFCINRTAGRGMVPETMTRVMRRDEVPDCETRSFRSCSDMSDGRMERVRHGESIPRRMNGQCMRCQCEDGEFQCSMARDRSAMCTRSDPQATPRNCMMDGQMVMHNAQREDGRCNRCGCRNGNLHCTRIPECRAERDSDSDETERDRENRMCDECMNMTASPVCAVRDGRTFPTRCHAMRCQGFERNEVEDGACADRDHCSRDRCGMGASCFARGGQTKMSRQNSMPEDRRLCVNRTELRCRPTEMRDGMRRIVDDDDQDPLEQLERDDEDDDDTRTACASDGNTYPSTCHMMVESSGDIPRVNHRGPCQTTNRSVCGADGMTYPNVETMRARGGNVRMDYMGECMRDNTPRMRCMMAMNAGRCQNLTSCTRRFMPSDGCCPRCGSAVVMAMDQEALDERVRITGDLNSADDFMDRFFRDRGMDREGRPMGPLINRTATDRCNISISRPVTKPGNTTEVMFMAREMRDGMNCHEHAMALMRTLNGNDEVPTAESGLVAAASVAPEEEVPGGTDGAPTFTATTFLVLLCAYLSSLF